MDDSRPSIAVVTGAAGGLGGAVAEQLSASGRYVIGVDLAAAWESPRLPSAERVIRLPCDVSDEESVREVFSRISEDHGPITSVAHCAGVLGRIAPLSELEAIDFDRVMSVNTRGTFLVLREAMKAMSRAESSALGPTSLVLVASVRGVRGAAGVASYVASKHAMLGLMKVAAIEGRASGIRVNAVLPGPIDTAMIANVDLEEVDAAQPQQIARPIVWLLSEQAGGVTGSEYVIDGGRLL